MSKANEPDQVNSGVLGVILVLVSLAVLAIALFVTSLVREETDLALDTRGQGQDRKARDSKNGQLRALSEGPTFSDRAKGLVQIPIDRAAALLLEAVRENPYALSPGVKPEGLGGAGPDDADADKADKKVIEKATDKKPEEGAAKKPAPATVTPKPTAPAPAPAPAPGGTATTP